MYHITRLSVHACVYISLSILLHLVNVHVILLIIPLQTAVRAPAEVVGLKLDLFHLKDQICPETQTSKVTSRKVLWNLCYKCSAVEICKYQVEHCQERRGCLHPYTIKLKRFNSNTVYLDSRLLDKKDCVRHFILWPQPYGLGVSDHHVVIIVK